MKNIFTIVTALLVLACDTDDSTGTTTDLTVIPECGTLAIVDKAQYDMPNDFEFTISEVSIEGNCIRITLLSGGCDGSSWEAELIDSEAIAESNPIQRYLKVALVNNEICQAIVNRTFEFDLQPIQVPGEEEIWLNLSGWEELVSYTY